MSIRKITRDVEWPGQLLSGNQGKWEDLRAELNTLQLGGAGVIFTFEDPKERDSAQAGVNHHAKRQNSKKAGWKFETTTRGNDLYVRKVIHRDIRR